MKTCSKAELVKLLARLVDAPGVSGYEDKVRQLIHSEISPYVDEVFSDKFGNLIAIRKASDPKALKFLMLAHMDEIGFVVQYIDEKGFIRFYPMDPYGYNIDNRILPTQRIMIHTRKGAVRGAIGFKGYHIMALETKKSLETIPYTKLFIDIGSNSLEEAKKLNVEIGAPITFYSPLQNLVNDVYMGKALDDRIGCSVLINTAKALRDSPKECTLIFAFTAQEELQMRGGHVISNEVDADVAVAVDSATVGDHPEVEEQVAIAKLGKGPVIRLVDRETIVNPMLKDYFNTIAKKNGIPLQASIIGGATDLSAIQLKGIPCIPLCIPIRYTHTPIETIRLCDAENAIKLLIVAIKEASSKLKL